jgi:hypothetical protein
VNGERADIRVSPRLPAKVPLTRASTAPRGPRRPRSRPCAALP